MKFDTFEKLALAFLKIGSELTKVRIDQSPNQVKVRIDQEVKRYFIVLNCDCSTRLLLDLVRNPEDFHQV